MQLGFFTRPIHPVDRDWRQSPREEGEAFILADELGHAEGPTRLAARADLPLAGPLQGEVKRRARTAAVWRLHLRAAA